MVSYQVERRSLQQVSTISLSWDAETVEHMWTLSLSLLIMGRNGFATIAASITRLRDITTLQPIQMVWEMTSMSAQNSTPALWIWSRQKSTWIGHQCHQPISSYSTSPRRLSTPVICSKRHLQLRVQSMKVLYQEVTVLVCVSWLTTKTCTISIWEPLWNSHRWSLWVTWVTRSICQCQMTCLSTSQIPMISSPIY